MTEAGHICRPISLKAQVSDPPPGLPNAVPTTAVSSNLLYPPPPSVSFPLSQSDSPSYPFSHPAPPPLSTVWLLPRGIPEPAVLLPNTPPLASTAVLTSRPAPAKKSYSRRGGLDLLVRLQDVSTERHASIVRGSKLFALDRSPPPDGRDEFYVEDLIGLGVNLLEGVVEDSEQSEDESDAERDAEEEREQGRGPAGAQGAIGGGQDARSRGASEPNSETTKAYIEYADKKREGKNEDKDSGDEETSNPTIELPVPDSSSSYDSDSSEPSLFPALPAAFPMGTISDVLDGTGEYDVVEIVLSEPVASALELRRVEALREARRRKQAAAGRPPSAITRRRWAHQDRMLQKRMGPANGPMRLLVPFANDYVTEVDLAARSATVVATPLALETAQRDGPKVAARRGRTGRTV